MWRCFMGFIKKNLLKVIELEFNENTLVQKFDVPDRYEIMKGSKLVVRPSQTAIFVHQGKIADIFGEGTYKLETANLPILSKLGAWKYGFEMPNITDIYFVNTVQFTNLKWGTANPIMLRDKDFGMIRLMGHGEYAFRITQPEVFLREYFGTLKSATSDRIHEYLKAIVLSELTDAIGESKISALDFAANYRELGDLTRQKLQEKFGKLGLEATEVIIKNLKLPEEVEKVMDKRTSLGVMGDAMGDYAKYESIGAMRDAAKNPGAGGMFASMGVGFGTGRAVGGAFASSLDDATSAKNKIRCPKCGKLVEECVKFCPDCGEKIVSTVGTVKCSKCGKDVPAAARFCPECGAPMKCSCPKCGKDVPAGAKFCPDCGEKL